MLELLTKTGAGPGMMEAVPLGYHEARQDLQQLIAVPPDLAAKLETQGSRIKLPFEQETTPYIQKLQQFAHFLPRRLALTESSAAFVVFPGGFGTLNEMFEVMRLGRPTLMDSRPFWSGMLDVLKTKWKERDLVEPKVLENMLLVDGVTEGLPKLMAAAAKAGAAKPPSLERAGEMTGDIQRGIATLSKLPSAVTFIGGSRLRSSDMEVGVAKDLASRLAKSGIHSRAGGDGAVLDAVSQGVRAARKDMEVQALLHDRGDLDAKKVKDKAEVFEVVRSEAVHKLLMYENTDAIVALPGGVGVFDEVWEVACLMQTGKLPKRPLVLVGKDFWQPFLDEVEKAMWQGKTKMIADGDMKLFTVVDDAAQASQLIRKHRAQREVEVQGA
jgi:uncharacterized protein (TIGR00730 family)